VWTDLLSVEMEQAKAVGRLLCEVRAEFGEQLSVVSDRRLCHVDDAGRDAGRGERAPHGAQMLRAAGRAERMADERDGGQGGHCASSVARQAAKWNVRCGDLGNFRTRRGRARQRSSLLIVSTIVEGW